MEKHHFTFSALIPLFIVSIIVFIIILNGGSFLYVGLIFVGLIPTLIINNIQNAKIQSENLNKMENFINNIPDFHPNKIIKAFGNAYIFAVDEIKEKVVILENSLNMYIFSYNDFLGCEIDIDGKTIFSKSTTRTIAGALVGKALFGDAGAVVGGLSGDSKQKSTIQKLYLILKIKNISSPRIKLLCFDAFEASARTQLEVSPDDFRYQAALNSAIEVKDIISIFIDQIDRRSHNNKLELPPNLMDQVEKLYSLKEKGIITDEEYLSQKTKLFNS